MIAEVIVDVLTSSLDKIFDYIVPDNLTLTVGYRVLLPFGNRQIEGYVIKLKNSSSLKTEKLKPIIKVLDNKPLILPELIDLIYFMKQTFNLRMVDVIRLVLPSQIRSGKVKEQIKEFVLFNENMSGELANIKANAQNQINAINYVKNNGLTNLAFLRSKFGASSVNTIIKKRARNNKIVIAISHHLTESIHYADEICFLSNNVLKKIKVKELPENFMELNEDKMMEYLERRV